MCPRALVLLLVSIYVCIVFLCIHNCRKSHLPFTGREPADQALCWRAPVRADTQSLDTFVRLIVLALFRAGRRSRVAGTLIEWRVGDSLIVFGVNHKDVKLVIR